MNKTLLFFYIPFPDETSAKNSGTYLIENKLAACVQYLQVNSNFLWNKQLENSDEIILLVKTLKSANKAVRKAIRKIHPYELPCIAHWEVKVNKIYYDWAKTMVD